MLLNAPRQSENLPRKTKAGYVKTVLKEDACERRLLQASCLTHGVMVLPQVLGFGTNMINE